MRSRIIAICHDNCVCRCRNYTGEKFADANTEFITGFSFKFFTLLSFIRFFVRSCDVLIFCIEPPLRFFRRLLLYFLLLFSNTKEIIILVRTDEIMIPGNFTGRLQALLYLLLMPFLTLLCFAVAAGVKFLFGAFGNFRKKRKYADPTNKNILYIATQRYVSKTIGGHISHIGSVIQSFKNLGWQVFLVSPGEFPHIECEKMVVKPFEDKFLPPCFTEMLYDLYVTYKTMNIIKKISPAFIYQRHGNYHLAGAIISFFTGIPYILEVNGIIPCEKEYWGIIPQWVINLFCPYEKISLKNAARISAISLEMKETLMTSGIEQEKIYLNPNGVDTAMFAPGQKEAKGIREQSGLDQYIVVGYAGTFDNYHGVDTIIEIVKSITTKYETTAFLLMGNGLLQKTVKEKLMDIPGKERVIFTGNIEFRLMPAYLDACNILMYNGGRGRKGFHFSPIKLFEYMAMEKPVISYNLGQMSRVVENGVDGVLVDPSSIENYIKGMEYLVENPHLWNKMGKIARRKVAKSFTWDRNAKRTLEEFGDMKADRVLRRNT